MTKPTPGIVLVSALLVGTLTSCSISPASRFYIIEPMTTSASTSVYEDLVIGVGPVTLPAHLERKEIVTYDERYRVNLAEFDRWAESLDRNITSALVENLSLLIPSEQVIAYPWSTAHACDYIVKVHVFTFGSDANGEVVLKVSWVIYDAADAPVKLTNARYSAPRQGEDVVALVAAMSQTIEQLSRDIASALPRNRS